MYRKYIKRLLDIIISLILILILWPIMLITALLVLIDLGRPLFNEIHSDNIYPEKYYGVEYISSKEIDLENLYYNATIPEYFTQKHPKETMKSINSTINSLDYDDKIKLSDFMYNRFTIIK